jgi:hypothetical protein
VLGTLASGFLERRHHEELGFRCVGDWSRERLGVGARVFREWARVWRALGELPRMRAAVLSGEVSWTVARKVVAVATPETDAACLETVRGRSVRAVEALVGALRGDAEPEEKVRVSMECSPRVATKWAAAVELARRVAGEELPDWEAAEAVAAEGASEVGGPEVESRPRRERQIRDCPHRPGPGIEGEFEQLAREVANASARELDRRLRAAIAFLQEVDLEIGRVLRQVVERRLYRELGFERFEDYVTEWLDVSGRTARRLVRLARGPGAVARAFRKGRITLLQAEAVLAGASLEEAERVTLRKLQEQVRQRVVFWAPADAAMLFRGMVARVGLEGLLDHAICTWLRMDHTWLRMDQKGHAEFERDGWRCTVPACTARRNLHSHHIVFRSAGGSDELWNRTTLCAWHHLRGVHAGRAPSARGARWEGWDSGARAFGVGVRAWDREVLS